MRTILAAVALAVLVLPARADDKPDPAAVLDQGIKALGGEAALTKFKAATWKGKGTLRRDAGDIEYTGEWAVQAPDRFKAVITGDAGGMTFKRVRVLAGDKGWTKLDTGDTKEMSPDALAEARRELHGQSLTRLLPLRDPSFMLAAVGATKVGDTPAVGVEATAKDGQKFRLFFDKDNGLLLKTETTLKPPGAAPAFKQEVLYGDYKDVGGIQHAMKITVKRDGRTVVEQEITEYQPLEKLDDKEFAPPS